jgi:hypothetical protein
VTRKTQKSKASRKGKPLKRAELKKVSGGQFWNKEAGAIGPVRRDAATFDDWSDQGL